MVQYRISVHARQRMTSRRITADDISAVLEFQTSTWHDPKQSSWVLSGTAKNGRTLLVYVPDDNWPPTAMITVKSAAWR